MTADERGIAVPDEVRGIKEKAGEPEAKKSWLFRDRPLCWLATATAIYLVPFILIVFARGQCVDAEAHWSDWLLFGLHQRYLGCRSLNELGDFLAGVFAPLALVWVAGAVYIQSLELKAQRDDLKETRAVMERHAAESEATKVYIGQQTEIQKRQQDQREQDRSDREFDESLKYLLVMFERKVWLRGERSASAVRRGRLSVTSPRATEPQWTEHKWAIHKSTKEQLDPDDAFHDATKRFAKIEIDLRERNSYRIAPKEARFLRDAIKGLGEMEKVVPRMSPANQIRARTLQLKRMKSILGGIETVADVEEAFGDAGSAPVKPRKPS